MIIISIMYLATNENKNWEKEGSGNYSNNSIIVHDKGIDYFAVGNKIYSMKNNNTEELFSFKHLEKKYTFVDNISQLSINNSILYFNVSVSHPNENVIVSGVYSLDLNSKKLSLVLEGSKYCLIQQYIVKDKYIYYTVNKTENIFGLFLYRKNIEYKDGFEEQLSNEGEVLEFIINESAIYYIDKLYSTSKKDDRKPEDGKIYKISLDGIEKSKVSEADSPKCLVIYNNTLWYSDYGIYKIDLEDLNEIKVIENTKRTNFNIHKNAIYYINEKNQLCQSLINEPDQENVLLNEYPYKINISQDYIYYFSNTVLRKIKVDGSNQSSIR